MTSNQTLTQIGLVKIIAMILSLVLLNIGLFFILFYFTPILTGLVGGYFLASRKNGVLVSFLSAMIAYIPIFVITQNIAEGYIDLIGIIMASSIMAGISVLGGYLGGILGEKSFQRSKEVTIT